MDASPDTLWIVVAAVLINIAVLGCSLPGGEGDRV